MIESPTVKRELKPVSKNNLLNKIMYKSHKHCNESTRKRINDIILSLLIKDVDSIKKFSFEGLPDEMPLLRSLIWKINLKYLTINLDKWDDYLVKKRNEYTDLKEAFIIKLEFEYKSLAENNIELINLSDIKLIEDIDKDIRRTHTNLNFFYMPSKKSINVSNEDIIENLERKKSQLYMIDIKEIYKKNKSTWETNGDVLARILYIYAKLNADVGYVQGMNEILAPIYYCFYAEEENSLVNSEMDAIDIQKEHDYQFIVDVEADSFWTFVSLMEDIKSLYIKDKDNEAGGVFNKLKILSDMLKIVDKDLFCHFNKIKIDIQLFAFKWVVLLFTQDFPLFEVMRIWDALLSEKDRFYMIYLICLSILHIKRKELIKSDFAGVINKLQKINNINCDDLIRVSAEIRKKWDKKLIKVMENK